MFGRGFWVVGLWILVVTSSSCVSNGVEKPLDRGTFHVSIQETLENRKTGELEATEVNISELLIARKLLQHGFTAAARPEDARYRIEGTLKCKFHQELDFNFQGQRTLLEHQYVAEFLCSVTDTSPEPGPDAEASKVERIDIPKMINGRTLDEEARRDIRRRAATTVAQRMVTGRLLGNPEVKKLIDSLGDVYGTANFNDVSQGLQDQGYVAVPFLLDALGDERPVRLSGRYPGLEEWNRDSLRYYHIADMALSDILMRSSALALDSSDGYRRQVMVGWVWAWEDLQQIPEEYREQSNQRAAAVKAGTVEDVPAAPTPFDVGGDGVLIDPGSPAPGESSVTPEPPTTESPTTEPPTTRPQEGTGQTEVPKNI